LLALVANVPGAIPVPAPEILFSAVANKINGTELAAAGV
jgi:hypothetical protein